MSAGTFAPRRVLRLQSQNVQFKVFIRGIISGVLILARSSRSSQTEDKSMPFFLASNRLSSGYGRRLLTSLRSVGFEGKMQVVAAKPSYSLPYGGARCAWPSRNRLGDPSSEQIAALVLPNTCYCSIPALRPPEAIFVFSTPVIRSIARPISGMFRHLIFRRMYWWQVDQFFSDAEIRNQFVPLLYQQFDATPGARAVFFRLNEDLQPTIRSRVQIVFKLKELRRPGHPGIGMVRMWPALPIRSGITQ